MDVSKSQVVLLVTMVGAGPGMTICGGVVLHTVMSEIVGGGVLSTVTVLVAMAVHPPAPDTVTVYAVEA